MTLAFPQGLPQPSAAKQSATHIKQCVSDGHVVCHRCEKPIPKDHVYSTHSGSDSGTTTVQNLCLDCFAHEHSTPGIDAIIVPVFVVLVLLALVGIAELNGWLPAGPLTP